ncbi:MAG: hypothetical protein ACLQOZ_13980 [Acidimicrobiales bacterium]|jgi:hypothetical protein
MTIHLDIRTLEPEQYEVTAAEGSVVTRHALVIHSDYLDQLGLYDVAGETVVGEVFDILLDREAIAGVPAESTLEQLGEHYSYLVPELRDRLSPGSQVKLLSDQPLRVATPPTP